jgi:DNA-binding transcriptional LysR family regulator
MSGVLDAVRAVRDPPRPMPGPSRSAAKQLRGIDLNLLFVLEALIAERSVTRAARRLEVTQSAASHALSRLRELLGDPILVRQGNDMTVTPRASALAEPLREVMDRVQGIVHGSAPFDPAKAQRSFTIRSSDYTELVLLPRVVARVRREAPGVDLRMRGAIDDAHAGLRDGTVDIVIGPMTDSPPGLLCQPLLEDGFVCVVRAGHPVVATGLSLEEYVALPHLLISPRGRTQAHVDEALSRRGLKRRVAVIVPHFLTAPFMLAESDLVLTLASRIARMSEAIVPVRVLPTPIDIGGFTFHQIWHERHQADAGHRWLRAVVREVAEGLGR